jgi:hypothetical protein
MVALFLYEIAAKTGSPAIAYDVHRETIEPRQRASQSMNLGHLSSEVR